MARRRAPTALLLLPLLLILPPGSRSTSHNEKAPPVYSAHPTGGPVQGGTTVTIVGREFSRISTGVLNRVKCHWGNPQDWEQAILARQQADRSGWSDDEASLPEVPPEYFTEATQLLTEVTVTPELRATFDVPASISRVDMLKCPSYPRVSGLVSLWFSLRYITLAGTTVGTTFIEPNLMDTGFTYIYYPAPANFTNAAITGGPVTGGTEVVIEGIGFTGGYLNESHIDLADTLIRCRFTDKPSIVAFRVGSQPDGCEADALTGAVPLSVIFDIPTNGIQLAATAFNGFSRQLTGEQVRDMAPRRGSACKCSSRRPHSPQVRYMAPRRGSESCLGGARMTLDRSCMGLIHTRSPSFTHDRPHSHTIALIHTRSPSYPRLRLSRQVDELFVFSSRGQGGPVRLADTYTGEWLDTRRLTLKAINARVTPGAVSGGDSQAAPTNLLQGGSSPLSASECL